VDTWIPRCFELFEDRLGYRHLQDAILAAATLVNFPGFQDVHEIIFNVVDARYEPTRYHCDPEEWEIYVKHRQLLAEFLTDQRRSGPFFVGTTQYLNLANFFWSFLTAPTAIRSKVFMRG
jgi:hypothetical protein